MRVTAIPLIGALCALVGMTILNTSAQGITDPVARGKYLVMSAGKCADCHGEQLQGGALDFLKPGMPVAYAAPKIAGLPQLSSAAATTFLQSGMLPGGKQARPPMPQYRFNHDDAAAIVAYLKSLK
ncbi:MAG: c-type cytochrome [Candidatus Eremiobacteraeota bacterium]|nr:c-type cytochrome [Candidatus Eremiobacteraeota bacterium]